jgi:hypothetical protein
MPSKRTTPFALQAATCTICIRPVDLRADCWRTARGSGSLAHVLCLAVVLTDGDAPDLPAAVMADTVNEAADELCVLFCQNRAHAGAVG